MQKEIKLGERISISTSNIQIWNEFLESREVFLKLAGELTVEVLDWVFANPKEVEKALTWMQALTCAANEDEQGALDDEIAWIRKQVYAVYHKPYLRTARMEEDMVQCIANLNQAFSQAGRGHMRYFSLLSAKNTEELIKQTNIPINNRVFSRVKKGDQEEDEDADGEVRPKEDES